MCSFGSFAAMLACRFLCVFVVMIVTCRRSSSRGLLEVDELLLLVILFEALLPFVHEIVGCSLEIAG